MTNEEIEKRLAPLFAFRPYTPGDLTDDAKFEKSLRTAPTKENVLRVARALVSEAYEEAAQITENWPLKEWEDRYNEEIAAHLRNLKNSLVKGVSEVK